VGPRPALADHVGSSTLADPGRRRIFFDLNVNDAYGDPGATRTLTPFGFQTERRSYWEAPAVYQRVSPFAHANRIQAPLLLIHGADDNNSGTYPIQSERLFQAIQGHGGRARLVVLPHEEHGYRGRESVLHVIAETFEWVERHAVESTQGVLHADA
jgi:dipeptidyl aminopeptidase/acylaminoacyl peptidase